MGFKSQLYGVKQKENNSYIYDRIDIFFNSDCIQSFILYNVGNFFKSWSKWNKQCYLYKVIDINLNDLNKIILEKPFGIYLVFDIRKNRMYTLKKFLLKFLIEIIYF